MALLAQVTPCCYLYDQRRSQNHVAKADDDRQLFLFRLIGLGLTNCIPDAGQLVEARASQAGGGFESIADFTLGEYEAPDIGNQPEFMLSLDNSNDRFKRRSSGSGKSPRIGSPKPYGSPSGDRREITNYAPDSPYKGSPRILPRI